MADSGALFDWKLADVQMGPSGTYTMISTGGTGGDMLKHPKPDAPSVWLAYVEVDDVAAATRQAKAPGATVMRDATEVVGAGTMTMITDPTGATIALWKNQSR